MILQKILRLATFAILISACSAPTPTAPPVTQARSAATSGFESGGPLVFVGAYTSGPGNEERSDGIFVYRMNLATGALSLLSKVGGPPNPSYLGVESSGRYLLAVSEWGQPGVGVSSYAIDAKNGTLALINSQPVGSDGPAYVTVDPLSKWVVTANYAGGSVTVLPLGEDGRLGAYTSLVKHQGSGPNKARQEAPHAHSALILGNRMVLAADLGIDRVMLYDLDYDKGTLTPSSIPSIDMKPGSGPRHMAYFEEGRTLYVVNELSSTLSVFQNNAGTFKELQTVSLLPADFQGKNTSADVHIASFGEHDGAYLYASNRGHDSLAIFSIDQDTGKLTLVGHQPTEGRTPRNFAIDPTGNFLLVANQDSGAIVTFRIDRKTGGLSPTGQVTKLAMPVCIKFGVYATLP